MADSNDPSHLNATEARGAATPGIVRYVLAASLALVIVAFIAVYLIETHG